MGVGLRSGNGVVETAAINVARVAPFRLGAIDVSPPTLQLERGPQRQTLEPRVMQVLVALAQAKGDVVTRDELIEKCWAGRIVGDNAIHRAISRLRDIAATIGDGCFRLETVNKVGYRLVESPPASAASQIDRDAGAKPDRRRVAGVLAVVAVLIVTAALILLWQRSSAQGISTIAVIATSGPEASALVDGLAADLARFSSARGEGISFVNSTSSDYRLTVSRKHVGNSSEADVALSKAGSSDILWSASFSAPLSDTALLRDRMATAVSSVTQCALHANNDTMHSPAGPLSLVFAACESLQAESDAGAVEQWRRVVAKEPGNAPAVATLAFVEAEWSNAVGWHAQATALRSAAQQHLRRARSMDGSLGLTYAAEALLIPSSHYGERIAMLDRGLAIDPGSPFLHEVMIAAREQVGWVEDAVASARRAVKLAPNLPRFRNDLISALAYAGYPDDARAEVRDADRLWPGSPVVSEARSRIELRFGDPAPLIRQIDRGNALPNTSKFLASGPVRALLLARANPTPENIENATKVSGGSIPLQFMLQNMAMFGRIDQAYALIADPRELALLRDGGTDILFRTYMRPLVLDRRFMPLANRLGLVQYWQSRGAFPDFCDDNDIPYNCKAAAARLRPAKAA